MAMSRLDYPHSYSDGIVHGYAEMVRPPRAASLVEAALRQGMSLFLGHDADADTYRRYGKVVLHCTTNGKTWSWALRPAFAAAAGELRHFSARFYCPRDLALKAYHNRTHLENPYRDLVDWAVADMAKRAKLPAADAGALQLGVAYEREAPAEVGKKLTGPCGPITYTGYPAHIGHFDIEDIHDAVAKAVADCAQVWAWQGGRGQWRPTNLEVMLHTGKKTMGLAFAPGTGHLRNKRTISLNDLLFKFYDAEAVWRVVVHELCHHYRDEVFASRDTDLATGERLRLAVVEHAGKGASVRPDVLATHDSVFVRELARVDKKVDADPYIGICFNEYADPSLVADAKAVAEAKKAKREAAVDWKPEAGRLWVNRLKDGHFSLYWVSLAEGGFKVKVGALGNVVVKQFLNRLGAAAGGDADPSMPQRVMAAAVTYSPTWPDYWGKPATMMEFVKFCEDRLGMFIIGLRAKP
jgi:hypothetical protein